MLTNRHAISICQSNAVVMAKKKKINDGNGRCSLSLHSSHREGDAAAIELFHIGG